MKELGAVKFGECLQPVQNIFLQNRVPRKIFGPRGKRRVEKIA